MVSLRPLRRSIGLDSPSLLPSFPLSLLLCVFSASMQRRLRAIRSVQNRSGWKDRLRLASVRFDDPVIVIGVNID